MRIRTLLLRADVVVGSTPGRWVANRIDLFGGPGAPLETSAFLDSFLPSLMPRTSVHQGLAAGVNVLTARAITGAIESVHRTAFGPVPLGASMGIRAAEAVVGHGLSRLPEIEDESLWRAGARTAGDVLRAAVIGGAVYDAVSLFRIRSSAGPVRPLVGGVVATSAMLVWASRRLAVRKDEIQRWPVVQEADTISAVGVGAVITTVGTGLGRAYGITGRALRSYLGPGASKQVVGRAANAALWATAVSGAYNAAIASIGRSNEKMERPFALPPQSPLTSGSARA